MNDRVPHSLLNATQTLTEVSNVWDAQIVPQLKDYIRVPAKSPMFDADWAVNGYIDTVVGNTAAWIEAQKVSGLTLEVVRLPGRTPVLFFEVEPTKTGSTQTVLMYGHLGKQPEFSGWRSDLGPWSPKIDDGKLYGRGGADDGYAAYAAVAAIQALKTQNAPHARIVGLRRLEDDGLVGGIDLVEIDGEYILVCLRAGFAV